MQLYETGRQFFHGPLDDEDDLGDDDLDEDDWFDMLHDAVSARVEADSPMGPLGLRYWAADGVYEVWVYPTPVELVGGRHDGEVVVPGFSIDLDALRAAFESVAAFGWNALGLDHPKGLRRRRLRGARDLLAGAGVCTRGREAGVEAGCHATAPTTRLSG